MEPLNRRKIVLNMFKLVDSLYVWVGIKDLKAKGLTEQEIIESWITPYPENTVGDEDEDMCEV